jgi:UDP-glucose 4-epimerase
MRDVLGFEPRYSTAEAFAEFVATMPPAPHRTEKMLAALAAQLPPVDADRPAPLSIAGGPRG